MNRLVYVRYMDRWMDVSMYVKDKELFENMRVIIILLYGQPKCFRGFRPMKKELTKGCFFPDVFCFVLHFNQTCLLLFLLFFVFGLKSR